MSVESIEVKAADAASMVQLLIAAGAYVIGDNGAPYEAPGLIIHQVGMRGYVPAGGGAAQTAMFYMVAFRDDCDPDLKQDILDELEPHKHTGEPQLLVSGGQAYDQSSTVRPVPRRFGKLALLESGWLGPQITTLAQLDAAVLGQIDVMVPAGFARESAKAAWIDSRQFERNNPTLDAMVHALGKTDAQCDALFARAHALWAAEKG
jgi:hypothetical protein